MANKLPTLNGLDVGRKFALAKPFRLEPIRQHQLAPGPEEAVRVPEEEGLVGEVAERLGDPDDVEAAAVAGSEELPHLLGVELEEPDPAAVGADGDEAVLLRRWLRVCGGLAGRGGAGGFAQPGCDLHLLAGDGDARHGAAGEGGGEEARGAAHPAAHVEDAERGAAAAAGRSGATL